MVFKTVADLNTLSVIELAKDSSLPLNNFTSIRLAVIPIASPPNPNINLPNIMNLIDDIPEPI